MDDTVPTNRVIRSQAIVWANCSPEAAYLYISSSPDLSQWLRGAGPIKGVESVEIEVGPYDHPGARRRILFYSGDTVREELIRCKPFASYSYKVTAFSDFLKKMTDAAFGQFWFETSEGRTRITWEYSYTYKNVYSRIVLTLFNWFFFRRFMQSGLTIAGAQLDKIPLNG